MTSPANPHAQARAQFERDGFCTVPAVIPQDLIERTVPHMDAVMLGHYETGVAPKPFWKPGDDTNVMRKVDHPHLADNTIQELVSHRALGQWAAAITGADMIQVWAVQLLYKPPSGAIEGSVGWHQDLQYWHYWRRDSELFTAWIALSDVTAQSGPVLFVPGSHGWGFLNQGDFFASNHDKQLQDFQLPPGAEWKEVAGILPPGGVSFHHRHTFHGSGPNVSNTPRRSFALHLRTEKSWPNPGANSVYVNHLDDPRYCPVIYGNR
ncbi:MAG: phytanoyl-CoA dioxygenase family protein [Lentisphaerae bacterium]|nr:phytanoyl-CoA dioxygenase family protein [Lentisphaerota bacterium]